MSYGAGQGNQPIEPGEMLASEADREAAQAVLKQAFEDQRLTQDEFEARIGSAVAARTEGELAALTRDLPPAPAVVPARRSSRTPLLAAGIGAAAVAGLVIALVLGLGSGPSGSHRSGPAAAPARKANPGPGGPAGCPVGTSPTALTIANALAGDPVYVEPGSSLLTAAQTQRLRTEIGSVDPGRIRMAAITPATARSGGGERTLANAIASCRAEAAGVTLVTAGNATYLVTSYPGATAASQAVEAALNTHASLAAGLRDAANRLATVDPGH